jgi:putative methylase
MNPVFIFVISWSLSDDMSRRELEIALDKTKPFDDPDWHAEQYTTPAGIAANLLWHLHLGEHLAGRQVLDLGCGTGRLGLGSILLGADHATLVDFDGEALDNVDKNASILNVASAEYDTVLNSAEAFQPRQEYDTAVMNPPFGTQDKGADTSFLSKATSCSDIVLSLHKAATQEYVMRWIVDHDGVILDQHRIRFPLKNTMHHHDRDTEHVDVIAIMFQTR